MRLDASACRLAAGHLKSSAMHAAEADLEWSFDTRTIGLRRQVFDKSTTDGVWNPICKHTAERRQRGSAGLGHHPRPHVAGVLEEQQLGFAREFGLLAAAAPHAYLGVLAAPVDRCMLGSPALALPLP